MEKLDACHYWDLKSWDKKLYFILSLQLHVWMSKVKNAEGNPVMDLHAIKEDRIG